MTTVLPVVCRVAVLLLAAACVGACGEAPTDDATVTALDAPAAAGSAEPHLARGDDGTIVLSWLEPHGSGVALRHSVLDGAGWLPARTVALGDDWFVNWADFPSVVPITGTLWAAHWLIEQPGGTYAYDIAVALSHDGGRTWLDPITPHTDGTPTEHGFVSLFPWRDGVGAMWLDGRNLIGGGHGHESVAAATGAEAGGTSLRTVTIAAGPTLSDPGVVDEFVCDCCQTDVAVGPDGPVAVYRNRTADEIRDIYVARVVDGAWQPGRPVAADRWTITGCPVNGPAVAVAGDRVAVAWFTAADDAPRVRLAVSDDRGDTFGQAIDVDVTDTLGRVDVEFLEDGDTVVSWLRAATDDDANIALRRISRNGGLGPVVPVARTGGGRTTGFPQMLRDGAFLVLAWTDTSVEPSRVRTARVDPAHLVQ